MLSTSMSAATVLSGCSRQGKVTDGDGAITSRLMIAGHRPAHSGRSQITAISPGFGMSIVHSMVAPSAISGDMQSPSPFMR